MPEYFYPIFYGAMALAGLWVFVRKQCWKPANVLGPERWENNENPAMHMILAGAGFLVWLFATQMLMSKGASSASTQPTTRPMDVRDVLGATMGQLIGFVAIILGNLALRKKGLATLGLKYPLKAILPGVGAALVAMPLVYATSLLAEWFYILIHYQHPQKHEVLEVLIRSSAIEKWVPILSAVIVAPLFEELLFRGHLQTFFKRSFHAPGNETVGAWMSILLSSGMFMIVHPAWTYPPIFVLAVCMGYVYERTGNLWSTILLHMLFNGTQVTFAVLMGG